MNVKLVFLPAMNSHNTFEKLHIPPLALYVLASVLQKEGHIVGVIDPCEFIRFELSNNIIQDCVGHIEEQTQNSEIIAFSSNTFNWGITKIVINKLSNSKNKHIIIGGLHPSIFDVYALQTTKAEFILRGEGEISFVELLNKLERKESYKDILGLTYKYNGEIIRSENHQSISQNTLINLPYQLTPLYQRIKAIYNYQ